MVRDSSIIPIELRIIKFVQNDAITDYLKNCKIKKKNPIPEKKTRIILFNTYGWNDYLLFILNPHNRCSESDSNNGAMETNSNSQNNSSKNGAMETSLLLWAYVDIYNILNKYSNENKYFSKIKELYESLNDISNNNDLLNILYYDGGDQLSNLENAYTLKDDDCLYILTFVKLNTTDTEKIVENATTDTEKIVENFAMFDYMGIWDSVILSKIKREHIENYKLKFLTNDRLPIQQTSSIILIPW